jgi:hypothetical protein
MPGILLHQYAKKKEKIHNTNRKIKKNLRDNLDIENVLSLVEEINKYTQEERKLKNIYIM